MRNLTLDLDALAVDSFSTDVASDPTQWAAMYPPSGLATCQADLAAVPQTVTNGACCED